MAETEDVDNTEDTEPEQPTEFWKTFQVESVDETTEEEVGLIITDVLETYGIEYVSFDIQFTGQAGKLDDIDLKRVSPISAIKASLIEQYASNEGGIIEFAVNEDGLVYLYEVGSENSDMDIYYTIPSATYSTNKVGVKVIGKKPRTKRVIFPWVNIVGGDSEDYSIWDATLLNSNCLRPGLTTASVITYKDPILESGQNSYRDGIDNMFEVEPYQSIVGFAWKITPPDKTLVPEYNNAVTITQQSQSVVPILIGNDGKSYNATDPYNPDIPKFTLGKDALSPSIGNKLVRRQVVDYGDEEPNDCQEFENPGYEKGEGPLYASVPVREGLSYIMTRDSYVNKFSGVTSVYLKGMDLFKCYGQKESDEAKDTPDSMFPFIGSDAKVDIIKRLIDGEHYAVTIGDLDLPPEDYRDAPLFSIQFANLSARNDNALFGTNVEFFIDESSTELVKLYTQGETIPEGDKGIIGKGTIFPTGDGAGMLVREVWASVSLDAPNFTIIDPNGHASLIARNLKVDLTAISIEDFPAPIAINGVLIENIHTDNQDNDPTTEEKFEDTKLEQMEKQMDSGRTLSLSLSTLSEDQTVTLSDKLYNLMKKDVGLSYKHTCDPMSSPKIGAVGKHGGIINSVTYSYTDSSSYLINVEEGPEYFGDFSGISGGFYEKKAEEVTGIGTIIQDIGDHINYKVNVDGVGDVTAINTYAGVLDKGDRVNVSIHNQGVEE